MLLAVSVFGLTHCIHQLGVTRACVHLSTSIVLALQSARLLPRPPTDAPQPAAAPRLQVVLGSACSGHGFKFSSLVGRVLADLALSPEGATPHDISLHRLSRERPGQAAVLDAMLAG